MTRQLQTSRINMQAFAHQGEPLSGTTPMQDLQRLAHETQALQADSAVTWRAHAELREGNGADADAWLHLVANASVPLTCQRCLHAVAVPVDVDQWYRFVATEEIAMAEDDGCEEDLLVMEPQFDLLSLLEDELLMALPLVPMHEVCPVTPPVSAAAIEVPLDDGKPNPFAVLAQLKKN